MLFHSEPVPVFSHHLAGAIYKALMEKGRQGMLNILLFINIGCDLYMAGHYNVFPPLMQNQYGDMFSWTCLDRNVLLIKCGAASAEFAVVLGSRQLCTADENIDSLSILCHAVQDIHPCAARDFYQAFWQGRIL